MLQFGTKPCLHEEQLFATCTGCCAYDLVCVLLKLQMSNASMQRSRCTSGFGCFGCGLLPPPLPLFYIGEVRQFIAHRSCSHKLQGQPLLSYVTPQKSPKTLYFSCPSIVFPASTKYCENKFFIVIHPNKSISELGRYKS